LLIRIVYIENTNGRTRYIIADIIGRVSNPNVILEKLKGIVTSKNSIKHAADSILRQVHSKDERIRGLSETTQRSGFYDISLSVYGQRIERTGRTASAKQNEVRETRANRRIKSLYSVPSSLEKEFE
jgi:hypothetical protein